MLLENFLFLLVGLSLPKSYTYINPTVQVISKWDHQHWDQEQDESINIAHFLQRLQTNSIMTNKHTSWWFVSSTVACEKVHSVPNPNAPACRSKHDHAVLVQYFDVRLWSHKPRNYVFYMGGLVLACVDKFKVLQ